MKKLTDIWKRMKEEVLERLFDMEPVNRVLLVLFVAPLVAISLLSLGMWLIGVSGVIIAIIGLGGSCIVALHFLAYGFAYAPFPKKRLNQEDVDWWFSKEEQKEDPQMMEDLRTGKEIPD